MEEKTMTLELKRPELVLLSVLLLVIFWIEIQTTLNSPISFGDEGFHTRMAQWIAENVEYPVWVPFTATNLGKDGYTRPPFWNILESSFFYIFGFDEAIPQLLVPFISVLTGISTYILCKEFYNRRIGVFSSILLITLPSFVTYSVLFYTDILVTFFMVMFLLFLNLAMENGRKLHMLAAGSFGALAFMTKLTGYSAYALLAMVLMYMMWKDKKLMPVINKCLPMLLIMIVIPGALFIRSYVYYGTPICYGIPIVSPITDRIFDLTGCSVKSEPTEYTYGGRTDQTGSETSVFRFGLTNYLEFAYGNLWITVFPFIAGLFTVYKNLKRPETWKLIDVSLFFMILIFAVLFFTITKRAEDTARFSLMWAPVISIVAGIYLDRVYRFVKTYQKHAGLIVFVIVLCLGYQAFISKIYTMYSVKQFSTSFFEACDWLKKNTPNDAMISTVWTYRTAYCSGRGVTASEPEMALSNDVSKILEATDKIGVTHIFIQKFSLSTESLSEKYPITYVRLLNSNPDHFKKVYENGPGLEECIMAGGCDGNIIFEILQ